MNCVEFEQRIALYVGGDLPDQEMKEVEAHLAMCESCRALEASLRATQDMFLDAAGREPSIDMVQSVHRRVMGKIYEQTADSGSPYRWIGWARQRWVWAAAAILILASLILLRASSKRMTTPEGSYESAKTHSTEASSRQPEGALPLQITEMEPPPDTPSTQGAHLSGKAGSRPSFCLVLSRRGKSRNQDTPEDRHPTMKQFQNQMAGLKPAVLPTDEEDVHKDQAVRMFTENENVVIYWLISADKEDTHEHETV
ncbi:MAG TPA: zf-HC2 domain-containing protein [Thermoanaerobaculia bacterium]|nr:zf-HC2 domain-containing protein [Thermoanaerobaculia bacterium]HUM29427.1 zf-HC2 domain-containing protein [Thermoanaerobaculia bacterium]HXK67673.1 zf-HC2 domain-containing protein [Thermoanaerobaculia bacterium]